MQVPVGNTTFTGSVGIVKQLDTNGFCCYLNVANTCLSKHTLNSSCWCPTSVSASKGRGIGGLL